MSLYARYGALLDGVLDQLVAAGALPDGIDRRQVAVEPPRDASHGDLATNAAMVLAKGAGSNPRAIAALIAPKLEALPGVTAVEIAGPGFINLRLDEDAWRDELRTIIADAASYGKSEVGKGERVNVEYVSANPTGPMHMGHCCAASRPALQGTRARGMPTACSLRWACRCSIPLSNWIIASSAIR